MDWLQVLTIIGALGGFILWSHSKLDADISKVDEKIESAHRRMDGLYQTIVSMQSEIKDIYKTWK